MLPRALWFSLLTGVCVAHALAQQPFRGVVWDSDISPTADDLHLISQTGVQAIRLPLITNPELLIAADSLGLALFQELPIRYLSAARLLDTLASASSQLAAALILGADHPSAKHYGLAFFSDASNDAACPYFADLARVAQEHSDVQVYYISPFVESDRCASTVDFVLLDVRHRNEPMAAIAQWSSPTPIGLGTVGWYAIDGAFGLRHDRSVQTQARFLETSLPGILEAPLHSVFVYRWKDTETASHTQQWGLLDAQKQPRPAYAVVRGIYTGTQSVFAFPTGSPATANTPGLLIFGWLVIFTLGILYTVSSPWRNLVHRFYTRHGFYLDSVRMGREFPGAACVTFMLVQALITGCTMWLMIRALQVSRAREPILAFLSPEVRGAVDVLVADSWRVIVLFGCFFLAYQLILLLTSVAVLERRRLVDVKRAFIVQVSAQWHLILLLPLLMMAQSFASAAFQLLAGITAASWLLASLVSTLRLVADYASIVPPNRRMASLSLLAPPALVLTGAVLWLLNSALGDSIGFWWRLVMQG